MLIPVLLFIVGLLCLIKGGDWFVDGATGIARRFHVPELLIGATVVSIGTTLPEVMVRGGVGNLFEVDTVQSVLHHVEHIANKTYGDDAKTDISIRVITDHIRSCTFMVSDGILPSNEGRGYVLRRLLRRAARHGRMLGIDHPFLVDLVETVIQSSESAYPELREHDAYIKKVIGTEEANFARTIDAGMNILNNMIDGLEKAHQHLLSGLDVFKLNDTFGFPLDLTKEIAAEQGLEIDEDGFHAEMKKQKERARAERLKKNISGWSEDLFGGLTAEPTVFTGYDTLNDNSVVVALSDEETLTDAIATDEQAKEGVLVVLDKNRLRKRPLPLLPYRSRKWKRPSRNSSLKISRKA